MKNIILVLAAAVGICALVSSCNDYETYGDQKEKERKAIADFISFRGIKVIEESAFHAQGDVTADNEYVYLTNSGVYMQIVRKGVGRPLQNQENADLLVRFYEQSIFDTTTVITNYTDAYDPDVMHIIKTGTTYTASFTYGIMYTYYSASVPSGWLVPFNYINLDSQGEISKVRLIVPHTQGHSVASGNVYPYFYEITFQRQPGL